MKLRLHIALFALAGTFAGALAGTVCAAELPATTAASVSATASAGASELTAAHATLAPKLAHNAFGRPLVLESQEASRSVGGDVYAVVDYPFATVQRAFASARTWCDVLILHLNTKLCRASGDSLFVRVGRKTAQDPDDAFALTFAYRLQAASRDYLDAQVSAPSGPLGSRDYRIELQAIPLGANRSFLRLHYSYGFGAAAKLATQGYLATSGSGKIGFTRTGKGYVGGLRGAVERNTMRYYLAVDSYLASLSQPPGRQFASRIQRWFDATEQYPAQLHEMDRASYLSMKQTEYAHQQAVALR
jgi:hypothetical protein